MQDAIRAGVDVLLDPARHINLKKYFWKIFACRALGLKCAVESIGLSWEGKHHRAIDDARNLARLAQLLLSSDAQRHGRHRMD